METVKSMGIGAPSPPEAALLLFSLLFLGSPTPEPRVPFVRTMPASLTSSEIPVYPASSSSSTEGEALRIPEDAGYDFYISS